MLDVPLEVNPAPAKREKALRYSGPKIGSIVMGKVTAVHVLHADVELSDGTISVCCRPLLLIIRACKQEL